MSNTLNKTYKELAIPYFNEVFNIVDSTLLKLNIPYYLVGVSAVALELLKKGIKPSRGTKDIDFAIMIGSLAEFEKVVVDLEAAGFNKVKAPWTLYHPEYKTAIDLLPFGQIEENDTVNFNERNTDLHFLGFKEVMQHATTIAIEEKIAQIPPLHGMVILKLIAWNDRPEERDNDLKDILLILKEYFDFNSDEIYEFYFDTFPDEFDKIIVAARVLGRKSAEIINTSEKVKKRVIEVLHNNTVNFEKSPIAERWARDNDWTIEYAVSILEHFKLGITETISIKPNL
jgi:predicted nucleotidyltransferase